MKKLDMERIKFFLTNLLEEKNYLEKILNIKKEQFLKDESLNKAVKYSLIVCVESILNILQHILAKDKGVNIESYQDAISKAKKYGIISEKLSNNLRNLIALRNEYLVHGYWKCDDSLLFKLLTDHLNDLSEFAKEIKSYLIKN